MAWYSYPIQFFAGALLANGIPHYVQGISGHWFQSPFASPPGVGESSPVINVLWGFLNFILSGLLLWRFWPQGDLIALQWLTVALGMLLSGLWLANHFGHVRAVKSGR